MKKYIFLIAIFASLICSGQSVKKALKQLQSKEYAKCKDQLEKNLEDNSNHPASNLVMGVLLTEKTSPYYKVVESWKYVSKAVGKLDAFDQSDLDEIAEYIDSKSNSRSPKSPREKVENLIVELENILIRYIREEHDLKSVYYMLENYPDYTHYDNIAHIRNQFEFYKCKQRNTLKAYDEFIKKFPDAAQIEKAKKLRNELSFKNAKELNTEEAYNSFIKQCPTSSNIGRAMELRDSVAYVSVKKKNSLQAYEHFVSNYPNAVQTVAARKKLYTMLYEQTKTTSDISVFNKFIKLYPESEHSVSVFDRKSVALGKEFMAKKGLGNSSVKWSKAFDLESNTETAQALAVTPDNGFLLAGLTKQNSKDGSDVWVLKLDNNGKMQWNAIIEQDLNEEIQNVLVSSKGEVVIVGYTQAAGKKEKNGWMYKLDSKGTKLLNKNLGRIKIAASGISSDDKIYLSVNSDKANKFRLQQYNIDGQKKWEREYVQNGQFNAIGFAQNDLILAGGKWILRTDPKVYIEWEDILEIDAEFKATSVNSKSVSALSSSKGGLFYSNYYLSGTPVAEGVKVLEKPLQVKQIVTAEDQNSVALCASSGSSVLLKLGQKGNLGEQKKLPAGTDIIALAVDNNGELTYLVKDKDFVLIRMNGLALLGK